MNNNIIMYKINKYTDKYINCNNLESKLIYSKKLLEYKNIYNNQKNIHNNQTAGSQLDDIIKLIDTKISNIQDKLSISDQIYNIVNKNDTTLSSIIGIPIYNKETDLIEYYQKIIENVS
jgi:hypothetical protein